VAALRNEWEAARKARQQAVIQRRAAVLEDLNHCQQVREQEAAVTRQTLADNYASIQAETSLYLTQIEQQRRTIAKQTVAQLEAFTAELREAVAELRAANRDAMIDVAERVAELKQVTQEVLAGHPRDRAVMRNRQQQTLAEYVAELEATVADYLLEIAENRQALAVVDQAQRHRDREALTEEVAAMRDDFAIYRQQLRDFRDHLRQSIWGDAVPIAQPSGPPQAASSTRQSATRKPRAKAQPTPASEAQPSASANGTQATAPVAKKLASSQAAIPTEEAVFDYLQAHQDGARLTEIESTLGINRFQAVDALRSLIQKELIIQKDRTYRIQEEAVL